MRGDKAIVLQLDERYFVGFNKAGQVLTAWSLPGATLFAPWREVEDLAPVETRLLAKGKKAVRREVGFQ